MIKFSAKYIVSSSTSTLVVTPKLALYTLINYVVSYSSAEASTAELINSTSLESNFIFILSISITY